METRDGKVILRGDVHSWSEREEAEPNGVGGAGGHPGREPHRDCSLRRIRPGLRKLWRRHRATRAPVVPITPAEAQRATERSQPSQQEGEDRGPMKQDFVLFSGTANTALATAVAAELGVRLRLCAATRFPDGETGGADRRAGARPRSLPRAADRSAGQ